MNPTPDADRIVVGTPLPSAAKNITADDVKRGQQVFFMKFLADRATSIDEVAIALEEAVKFLRTREDDGFVLDAVVDGGRVAIRPGP